MGFVISCVKGKGEKEGREGLTSNYRKHNNTSVLIFLSTFVRSVRRRRRHIPKRQMYKLSLRGLLLSIGIHVLFLVQ